MYLKVCGTFLQPLEILLKTRMIAILTNYCQLQSYDLLQPQTLQLHLHAVRNLQVPEDHLHLTLHASFDLLQAEANLLSQLLYPLFRKSCASGLIPNFPALTLF